jgi:hypothetical protein
VKWIDYTLPNKKGDPGRPIIPIFIECHIFPEAICDFSTSVNIMPKVIHDKILGDPLLDINMHLQLADQTLCYPKGVLKDAIIRVGQSFVLIDFVVVDTEKDEKAPIIFGRPFLCTRRPSSMHSILRLFSLLRTIKRSFHSRTRCCTHLHNPMRHPREMNQ